MIDPKRISAKVLKELLSDISTVEMMAFSDIYLRGDSAGNFVVVDGEDILLGYIDVGKETYERFESITEDEDGR